MYARDVDNRTLTFGVSGKLIRNNLVMYDRETGTLWSQFLSQAIKGPLTGHKLESVTFLHTTWENWRSLHPDTTVLDKGGRYASDAYASYYSGPSAGIHGRTFKDDRLGVKEFVIGVAQEGYARAYPFRDLSDAPVVNDVVGATKVLVVFEPDSATGVVYNRTVDNRELHFEAAGADGEGHALLRDEETGTVWRGVTGEAIEGPLAGTRLRQVSYTYSFWFAWRDHYMETSLFRADVS